MGETDKISSPPTANVVWDEVHPFDLEGGLKKPTGRSRCALCCKIMSALLLLAAATIGILIWQKVIWFDVPTADYVADQSSVTLTGVGGTFQPTFSVKIAVKVNNPNNYALSFKDVKLDLYDYTDMHLGQAKHPGKVKVDPKATETFTVEAKITTTAAEVAALGANCAANNMRTKATARGQVKGMLGGVTVPFSIGPYHTMVKCEILQ